MKGAISNSNPPFLRLRPHVCRRTLTRRSQNWPLNSWVRILQFTFGCRSLRRKIHLDPKLPHAKDAKNAKALIRSIQEIMHKDVGVDGGAPRISQLVWLLFLKIFHSPPDMTEADTCRKLSTGWANAPNSIAVLARPASRGTRDRDGLEKLTSNLVNHTRSTTRNFADPTVNDHMPDWPWYLAFNSPVLLGANTPTAWGCLGPEGSGNHLFSRYYIPPAAPHMAYFGGCTCRLRGRARDSLPDEDTALMLLE